MTWLVLEPEICLMKTYLLEFCLPVKLESKGRNQCILISYLFLREIKKKIKIGKEPVS